MPAQGRKQTTDEVTPQLEGEVMPASLVELDEPTGRDGSDELDAGAVEMNEAEDEAASADEEDEDEEDQDDEDEDEEGEDEDDEDDDEDDDEEEDEDDESDGAGDER